MNREAWLNEAVHKLNGLWSSPVPECRVSVGWPGGRGKKDKTIGQCWATKAAEDEVAQIFVSPVLSDPVEVLAVLAHELCHALDDCESGHRGHFVELAKEAGLVGPWTATTASDELRERLSAIAAELGEYPHAALTAMSGRPVQTTRMLKAECVNNSGYKVRLSRKWINEYGAPYCPCCNEQMEVSE